MPNGPPFKHEVCADDHHFHIPGSTAVVTGGASGIGKGIAKALLRRGARVVIADIEEPVLEQAVGELSPLGRVEGMRTDVSDEDSVTALADHVFEAHGACNLLFCNAGVTSGGGGKPWQQEPNDWRWCFGGERVRRGHLHVGVRAAHDRVGRARPGDRHLLGRRRLRASPYRLGVRLVQGRGQLFHRGPQCQPHQRGHQPASFGVLPVGRADGHGPVQRPTQPA